MFGILFFLARTSICCTSSSMFPVVKRAKIVEEAALAIVLVISGSAEAIVFTMVLFIVLIRIWLRSALLFKFKLLVSASVGFAVWYA